MCSMILFSKNKISCVCVCLCVVYMCKVHVYTERVRQDTPPLPLALSYPLGLKSKGPTVEEMGGFRIYTIYLCIV